MACALAVCLTRGNLHSFMERLSPKRDHMCPKFRRINATLRDHGSRRPVTCVAFSGKALVSLKLGGTTNYRRSRRRPIGIRAKGVQISVRLKDQK